MKRFKEVSALITIDRLQRKVDFISKLTGIEFNFVPGTLRGTRGYMMLSKDPAKASPFIPDGLLGRSRHEANKTLDAILAGIGFVASIPEEKRPDMKAVVI